MLGVVNKNRNCFLGADHNCTWTQSGVSVVIVPVLNEDTDRIPFSAIFFGN